MTDERMTDDEWDRADGARRARLHRMSPREWTTLLVAVAAVGGIALGFLLGTAASGTPAVTALAARPGPGPTTPVPTVTVTENYTVKVPVDGQAAEAAPGQDTSDRSSGPAAPERQAASDRASHDGQGIGVDPSATESARGDRSSGRTGEAAPTSHPSAQASAATGETSYGKVDTETKTTTEQFAQGVADAYNSSGAQGKAARVSAHSKATGKTITVTCRPQGDKSVKCTGGRNASIVLRH